MSAIFQIWLLFIALFFLAALIVGVVFLIRYLNRSQKKNDENQIKKMKIEDL